MPGKHTSGSTLLGISIIIAAIVFFILHFYSPLDPYIIYLASLSLVTLSLYGIDKLQAVRGGSRIQESVLYCMSLFGGFPGGWLGMFLFRHKIRHPTFWLVLILSTLLHAFLFYYGYIQLIFERLGM